MKNGQPETQNMLRITKSGPEMGARNQSKRNNP